MLDLLVIGAGLAGLSAAWTAAQAGLRVRVVAKGLGALHWQGGTLDVLGYLPGSHTPVTHPFAAMAELPAEHPYRRMGTEAVQDALLYGRAMLEKAGVAYYISPSHTAKDVPNTPIAMQPPTEIAGGILQSEDHNLLLPSGVGVARPTWAAPVAQAAGDLTQTQPALIVGVRGLRDFYPALIAEHLVRQGIPARPAWLPLEVITPLRDRNPAQVAQVLDGPAAVDALAAAIKPLLRVGERVGLPAILGWDRHAETLEQLQSRLNVPVFEVSTLPPSVPGIRVHRALVGQLAAQGVRVEAGMEAIGAEIGADSGHTGSQRVQWVETASSSRPLCHRAHAYLLATGGFLGGGFGSDARGQVWESVFGLPLAMPATRQEWFRSELLDPEGQPIFRGGVVVDDAFQPIDPATGARRFANLWAAGNCLAHADAIRERSLEGIALATGVTAARRIIEALPTL